MSAGASGPAKNAFAKQWVDMVNEFQQWSLSTRLGIPMIYGIDAVHYHNNVYKATIFLTMLALELPGKSIEKIRYFIGILR